MAVSYTFDPSIEDEEKLTEQSISPLLSLTDNNIHCPKCGTINSFKNDPVGTRLNYFCERCSVKLNDYWDAFQNGKNKLIKCKSCKELTFDGTKYCVFCGSIDRVVARQQTKHISKQVGDARTRDEFFSCGSSNYSSGSGLADCLCCCIQGLSGLGIMPKKMRVRLFLFYVVGLIILNLVILVLFA